MKTKIVTVYTFDELSDEAKEKARDWYREGALDYDWWESTYEDAARAGLKITEFDCDRGTIKATLDMTIRESCTAILKDHGPSCDTYTLAKETLDKLEEEETDEETEEYCEALAEEYLSILRQEVEFQLSDDTIDDNIKGNEYTFTEAGTREN